MKQNIRIETGKRGLKKIQKDWNEIIRKLGTKRFFHYFEWYESYIDALEKNVESVFFIVISNCTVAEAIFPLKKNIERIKGVFFDILELPDHTHLQLKDIIYPECFQTSESIRNLITHLKSSKKFKWDFIRLSNLLPDSCALKAFNKYPGLKVVKKKGTCCYIPIKSYEKIEANLSKNMRVQLKKVHNKVKAIGELHDESFQTLSELTKAYPVFLELETSGWKGMAGTRSAIKCNQALIEFYNLLINRFSANGEIRIHILYIDELPIAGQFGFIINDTYYLLKSGYNEAMSKLSPGNLHREFLLKKYALKQNIKYFNLVSGEYIRWHKQWKASSHDTYEVIIFNRTLKGLLAFAGMQAKLSFKPYYQRFIKPMLGKTPFLPAKT